MKVGVIDIGSNSVRLMMSENGKTLYKEVNTTRLAEGLGLGSALTESAMERTARAVSFYYDKALKDGAQKVYGYATAAVRRADNGKDFVAMAEKLCPLKIDVISGETEAKIGALGALKGRDGGIIDVGGASSEVTAYINGKRTYFYSLDLGAVKLTDLCGQNENALRKIILEKVEEYGIIPKTEFYGIGGTATSLCSSMLSLEPYDPKVVDGYKISADSLRNYAKFLINTPVEERKKIKGLQVSRAEVIAGGALLLSAIVDRIGLTEITVSEGDGLEGYLTLKG